MILHRNHFVVLTVCAVALVAGACATTVNVGAEPTAADASPPPTFIPQVPDGGDAARSTKGELACIGTECPAPYSTCSDKPSFKCGTNLLTDPNNCGACGVECKGFDGINMSASCAQGACAFECQTKEIGLGNVLVFKNCNGLLDDGCEVNVDADPQNCGVCGNVCPSGTKCIKGRCGCGDGKTECNGRCVDTRNDRSNCGACSRSCSTNPVGGCNPKPPNTDYGCGNSQCDVLACKAGFADCNNDLRAGCASDGCEVNIKTDRNNCGGCGLACAADQECRDDGAGFQCPDVCEKSGLTKCGTSGCRDLVNDKSFCGSCKIFCPNARNNQVSSCRKGLCELECLPGFADCNGDPTDGCEIDLRVHPANCGGCGKACDFGAGQPCIDGKCLMTECEAGVSR